MKKFSLLALLALCTISATAADFEPKSALLNLNSPVAYNVFKTSVMEPGSSFTGSVQDFVSGQLKIEGSQLKPAETVPLGAGGQVQHFRQVINGIEVANAHLNVQVDKDGSVAAHGDSFFRGAMPALAPVRPGEEAAFESSGMLKPEAALVQLLTQLRVPMSRRPMVARQANTEASSGARSYTIETGVTRTPVTATFKYVQVGDKLELAYNFVTDFGDRWYETAVSARDGKMLLNVNYVADGGFSSIVPVGILDPVTDGGARAVTSTPEQDKAWFAGSTKTQGNNAKTVGGSRLVQPDGGANLDFTKFTADFAKEPSTYTDASTVQLHYVVNQIHDIVYPYGFDEKSGNFQVDNAGKGGAGNDAVDTRAQEPSGTNNANFATPPDGQTPRMNMYLWTTTQPGHDGTYDTGIPIHEYTHGISNRLTGGPSRSDCLRATESGGMGEGWSDTLGFATMMRPSDTRDRVIAMGAYATNRPTGVRKFAYSTDLKSNPSTYSFIDKPDYKTRVHAIGEVWAVILYEVYWNLRDAAGFEPDLIGGAKSGKGNTIFIQTLLDGMKLQPCNPNFIQARDAILQAEKTLTQGKYQCDMWRGFAKRGLGANAKTDRVDNFDVPDACKTATTTGTTTATATSTETTTAPPNTSTTAPPNTSTTAPPNTSTTATATVTSSSAQPTVVPTPSP